MRLAFTSNARHWRPWFSYTTSHYEFTFKIPKNLYQICSKHWIIFMHPPRKFRQISPTFCWLNHHPAIHHLLVYRCIKNFHGKKWEVSCQKLMPQSHWSKAATVLLPLPEEPTSGNFLQWDQLLMSLTTGVYRILLKLGMVIPPLIRNPLMGKQWEFRPQPTFFLTFSENKKVPIAQIIDCSKKIWWCSPHYPGPILGGEKTDSDFEITSFISLTTKTKEEDSLDSAWVKRL